MARSLVIVESPAKAKTINKFLGKGFVVKASMGHVRDLPKKTLGVDEKTFTPTYVALPEKKKTLTELKKAAKDAGAIFLAADPDREGEAICWHLKEELSKDTDVEFRRVLFNEITKKAILAAFENPREIDANKVDAQQARRILDRLRRLQDQPAAVGQGSPRTVRRRASRASPSGSSSSASERSKRSSRESTGR